MLNETRSGILTMMMNEFRLDAKVAVVTVGGRRLGKGMALSRVENGAYIGAAARTKHEMDKIADEVYLGSSAPNHVAEQIIWIDGGMSAY
jgi:7-alpha-hydroxysteroid dehydrogenase